LIFDQKFNLLTRPGIVTDGTPFTDGEGVLFDEIIYEAVETAINSIPRARRRQDDAIREPVRNAVRRTAEEIWGKKPVCHVVIHRL
jgi:ribonuclease J